MGCWGCLSCCCCTGVVTVLLRNYFKSQQQPTERYRIIGDEDSDEDDDFAGPEEAEANQISLQDPFVTPHPAPTEADLMSSDITSGTDREAWIAEMNAELAEFDALTSFSPAQNPSSTPTLLPVGTMPQHQSGDVASWQDSLELELSEHYTKS
mmetsp:Transcript_56520/g.93410  ORF Transcript_56520/g.93410 Transcript_56520/m.93410 type:complete len:153 (-) Transcript_56520:85-543(-)